MSSILEYYNALLKKKEIEHICTKPVTYISYNLKIIVNVYFVHKLPIILYSIPYTIAYFFSIREIKIYFSPHTIIFFSKRSRNITLPDKDLCQHCIFIFNTSSKVIHSKYQFYISL